MKAGGAGMTNEEAIKVIDALIFQTYLGYEVECSKCGKIEINNRYNALTLAKEALEKQMPKKPLEIKEIGKSVSINASSTISSVVHNYEGLCPNCKTQNTNRRIETRVSYCENCGQALDWSDIDE